jgi:hypothetical protein
MECTLTTYFNDHENQLRSAKEPKLNRPNRRHGRNLETDTATLRGTSSPNYATGQANLELPQSQSWLIVVFKRYGKCMIVLQENFVVT